MRQVACLHGAAIWQTPTMAWPTTNGAHSHAVTASVRAAWAYTSDPYAVAAKACHDVPGAPAPCTAHEHAVEMQKGPAAATQEQGVDGRRHRRRRG